jgi:hypothetical protein
MADPVDVGPLQALQRLRRGVRAGLLRFGHQRDFHVASRIEVGLRRLLDRLGGQRGDSLRLLLHGGVFRVAVLVRPRDLAEHIPVVLGTAIPPRLRL